MFFPHCLRKFVLLTNKIKFKSPQTLYLLEESGYVEVLWNSPDCRKRDARINSLHECSILHAVGTVYFTLSFIIKVYVKEEYFISNQVS